MNEHFAICSVIFAVGLGGLYAGLKDARPQSESVSTEPGDGIPSLGGKAPRAARPVAVTVLCTIGFTLVGVMVMGLLMALLVAGGRAEAVARYGDAYLPVMAVTAILNGLALVGYWTMKRWGVILFAVLAVLNVIVGLVTGEVNSVEFVFPAAAIYVGVTHYRAMT